jgi:uncharacterized zinc-type alcohol dehydrogenase-like protein
MNFGQDRKMKSNSPEQRENQKKGMISVTSQPVTGYAAMASGLPLVPFSYLPPELGEHDVRVCVTHCGLCYSDVHAIDNFYGDIDYPFVPGHEIVGTVSEVGVDPSGLQVRDRVGIGWQGRSCGHCQWCLKGEEQLCPDVVTNGVWVPYGGFASSVVADSRFVYPLPESMPAPTACVLLCAGISVYTPLKRYQGPNVQRIGIIGIGGLGHLAVQFAHAMGCHVTTLSSSAAKREEALSLGADDFVCTEDKAAIRLLVQSLDLLLCTAHGDIRWESLLGILKIRGKFVLVGFPNVAFNPTDLVAHELTLQGSFVGNRATMREMLSFAQQYGITPRTETMPMSRVNEAIKLVRHNKARYRIVLTNG